MSRLVVPISILIGLLLWIVVASRMGPLLLPQPDAVLVAAWAERARLVEATLHTAAAALLGLAAATCSGILAAVLTWRSRLLQRALTPYTILIQVIPIVAIAPLLVVWFGYGRTVAATTAGIASFYPIFAATGTGLIAPGPELVDLLRLYGAGPWAELRLLRLPAALPSLLSGLRSAAGLAVIGAIVGEFVGSNGSPPTLGWLVVYSARAAETALCFAAIGAASLLALAFHLVLRATEARAIGRWYGTAR